MAADLTTSLALHWPAQETSGTNVEDLSANAWDGTHGATIVSDAGPGGALPNSIPASQGTITGNVFTTDVSSWAVSAWIKGTADESFSGFYRDFIISPPTKLIVRLDDIPLDGQQVVAGTDGGIGFESETYNLASTLLDVDWHLILVQSDGANQSLYVDNTLISSPAHTRNLTASSDSFSVGGSNTTSRFGGTDARACGVRLFTGRTLDADSRQALYDEAKPQNTVAPVISGTPTVGETLSCTTGTWVDDSSSDNPSSIDGTTPYQWKADGTPIGGATSSTYELTGSETGANITCDVMYTNGIGSTTATSNSLGPVAGGGGSAVPRGSLSLMGMGA